MSIFDARDKYKPDHSNPYDRHGPEIDRHRTPQLEIVPLTPTPERKWDSIIPLIDTNELPEDIPGRDNQPGPMIH